MRATRLVATAAPDPAAGAPNEPFSGWSGLVGRARPPSSFGSSDRARLAAGVAPVAPPVPFAAQLAGVGAKPKPWRLGRKRPPAPAASRADRGAPRRCATRRSSFARRGARRCGGRPIRGRNCTRACAMATRVFPRFQHLGPALATARAAGGRRRGEAAPAVRGATLEHITGHVGHGRWLRLQMTVSGSHASWHPSARMPAWRSALGPFPLGYKWGASGRRLENRRPAWSARAAVNELGSARRARLTNHARRGIAPRRITAPPRSECVGATADRSLPRMAVGLSLGHFGTTSEPLWHHF